MRVVIDSNVLARATPGKTSAAREVVLLLLQPPHCLLSSAPLLTELARILKYPRVCALHGLDDAGILDYLVLAASTTLVIPVSPSQVPAHDPDDEVVIATAVAGQADVICTWDRHLLAAPVQTACAVLGIRILRDGELLQELRKLPSVP